jgi:hypothetical protein
MASSCGSVREHKRRPSQKKRAFVKPNRTHTRRILAFETPHLDRDSWLSCDAKRQENVAGFADRRSPAAAFFQAPIRRQNRGNGLQGPCLESVRKHQAGLQSFRSMRRIEARRRNASALRLRFSQSLASLRQRLSQAMVRSTIQRLGNTTKPLA